MLTMVYIPGWWWKPQLGARARVLAIMNFTTFVNESPTPYHAVRSAIKLLKTDGYTGLSECEPWKLSAGKKYYVTRNASSLIAFHLPSGWVPGSPAAVVGAHTDSPTLRLKPRSKICKNGYVSLGVEVYGGGLWPTWFDRDLSVAGRVYYRDVSSGSSKMSLVSIEKPLLRIPTLAIHLHREQSNKLEFNKETHLQPILQLEGDKESDDDHPSGLMALIASQLDVEPSNIEDFELVLYDTQKAVVGGLQDEFIFSPRLDNLNSCFCCVNGLIDASGDNSSGKTARVIALFDHEEVGSVSAQGAASNFLEAVLARINNDLASVSIAQSFLISADMAHAVHPNYSEKHEARHHPQINGGPVVKVNANQRYATNSYGTVLLSRAAEIAGIPLQKFVVRNDSPCGSTIGPMLSSSLGMRTIDIGNPQLSMHSIRETGGVADIDYSVKLYRSFFANYDLLQTQVQRE